MLPPKKYRTVKQPRGSRSCGIATAAMVVGKGLTYAMNHMRVRRHRDGQRWARTRDMLEFLGAHGVVMGMWAEVHEGQVESTSNIQIEWCMKGHPAILTVKSNSFGGCLHYVFWDGEHVRDPSLDVGDVSCLEQYSVIEIIPLIYLDERPQARKG